jgi:hypothetical protein
MIGFYLEVMLKNCPIYWQNFVNANQNYTNHEMALRVLNRKLKPYRARYIPAELHDIKDKVIFEDTKDLTWFILRWS